MRNAEVPIKVLKKYLDLFDMGESTKNERIILLDNERILLESRIKKMEEARDRLVIKLDMLSNSKLDEKLEIK